jgi:FkbM family methyltransferase
VQYPDIEFRRVMITSSIVSWKVAVSKQLKRMPPVFDAARRATRMLGERTPIYDLLAKASRILPEVAFIQIGSNDGISVDPIREFVVSSPKWHGAFVEPVPQIFAQLRQNYSYLRGRDLSFFNVAVSKDEGTKQFWKIKDNYLGEFPLFAYQIGSFDREHILRTFRGHPNLENKLEAIDVPCRSYEQIRTEAGLTEVHVLHMDVEGHEDQILNSIDFSRSKPLIVLYEILHMSELTMRQISAMLQGHGYHLREVGVDCIATLREFD